MGRKRRKTKSRKRRREGTFNFKRALLVLPVLLCIIYVAYLFFTLFGIKARDPLSETISSHKFLSKSVDDLEKTVFIMEREVGDERAISDIYVFLNNKEKENSVVIYIPGTLYFNGLEGEFGSPIPMSSLRYAGDFLQEEMGVEYTLWQLNEILGFRATDYIWITTEAYEVINDAYGDVNDIKDRYKEMYVVEQGRPLTDSFLKLHAMSSQYSFLKSIFNASKIKSMDGQIYSNLSFLNVLNRIGSFSTTVKDSTTYVMDLSSPKYSVDELSDQGGQIRMINVSEYDKALRRHYINIVDRDLERERVRIEVYNGSGVVGRAGVYARKILNNGCDVVRFGNAPDSLERTQIYVSNEEEFSNSLRVVEDVFFGKYERLEERPSFMTTGDIVILLGEDISQLEIF
jgi:hypothetical protein